MNETHHLMETRKNLERALNETEGPMRVTSECVYHREGRKGIDLVISQFYENYFKDWKSHFSDDKSQTRRFKYLKNLLKRPKFNFWNFRKLFYSRKLKDKSNYKPGQYYNIYVNKEKNPYTPISIDKDNIVQFFIKNYKNNKISEKICSVKNKSFIHVDGPFGLNYYDKEKDVIMYNCVQCDYLLIWMYCLLFLCLWCLCVHSGVGKFISQQINSLYFCYNRNV